MEDESIFDEVTLLGELLDVTIPSTYARVLRSGEFAFLDGHPLLGLPISPELDSVFGATHALWVIKPELKHGALAIQLRDTSFLCLNLRASDQDDPPVLAVSTNGQTHVYKVADSFTAFLAAAQATAGPLERITQRWATTAVDQRPALIADLLNLTLPPDLSRALIGMPHHTLRGLLFQAHGSANDPVSVLRAFALLYEGAQAAPEDLFPFMKVDERSLACVVCAPRGKPPGPDFGHIVRWHLDTVPARAQRRLLDTSVTAYVAAITQDLITREAGLVRMRALAVEYEESHAGGERLPKAYEERPIRFAVQNVIVGLAAFHHDSSFDGLSVSAWLSCQVPHVNAHEGCRGLAAMTLSEAFRSGGTMEIRFDRHPQHTVPATLRQYARTQGLSLGVDDPKAISPVEARALYLAVTQMPQDLRGRVERLVDAGVLSAERACFVLMSGIWKAIELDFILGASSRAASILRGGAPPFQRPVRQAELGVMRAAIMLGMLWSRLRQSTTTAGAVAQVLEDERQAVQWSILETEGAVLFTQLAAGQIPWQRDTTSSLQQSQSLVVLPRPFPLAQDQSIAKRLGQRFGAKAAVLQPAGHPLARAADNNDEVITLVCPDGTNELDKVAESRLLSCRVGRA